MNELVSVVLPVYNGEKYLRESIDSILAQTWKNWELIIVDDCSSDATAEIAQNYAKQDSRIHYYRNEYNLRLPRNLNRGFSLTHGNYLTWTSDDNLYLPTAIDKMVHKLQEKKAEFVFASCRIIDGEGKDIEYIMASEARIKTIVGQNPVGACFMYTRKAYETVGEYDPEFTFVEDWDYWQRIVAKFQPVIIEEILYKYRWHDGTLTSTMKKDIYNQTKEKMLLKNRNLFGHLDWEQKYYYYTGISICKKNLGEKNTYAIQKKVYSVIYLLFRRIPGKLKRVLCVYNK